LAHAHPDAIKRVDSIGGDPQKWREARDQRPISDFVAIAGA